MKFPSVAEELARCCFYFVVCFGFLCVCVFGCFLFCFVLTYSPFKFRFFFLDTKNFKEIYLKCLVGFFIVAGSEVSFLLICFDQAMIE